MIYKLFNFFYQKRSQYRKLLCKLRGYLLFKNKEVYISNNVEIRNRFNIHFKGNSLVSHHVNLRASNSIIFGKNTTVCSYTTIEGAGGNIEIGDNVVIGEFSTIQGQGGVYIDKNVLLASHVHLISNMHSYSDVTLPIKEQTNTSEQIKIEENAWIGINVTILSGVTVGKNSVIGSGAIVNKDIPPFSVAVGQPARIIKKYCFEKKDWIKV